MYHYGTVKTFVPLGLCCDSAVVKVDKHKKFCLTIQMFIIYLEKDEQTQTLNFFLGFLLYF